MFVMELKFQTGCILQSLFSDQRCSAPELDRTHEFRKEKCSVRWLVMHLCFGRTYKHVQSLDVTFHYHNLFSSACSFTDRCQNFSCDALRISLELCSAKERTRDHEMHKPSSVFLLRWQGFKLWFEESCAMRCNMQVRKNRFQ